MEILKNFVVFEGIDGSGTTTQLDILEDFFLHNRNGLSLPPFHRTFEPTDGIIGKIIRRALGKEVNLSPETVAFLFAADRNEHLFAPDGVKERCLRGEIVVSDRYFPSSLVYQGISCGEELPIRLNTDFPGPELLLFFDLDAETAQKRMENRPKKEIFEYLDFQIKVRRRYHGLLPELKARGIRTETIDASLPPEEVAAKVWEAVKEMPIFKG